MHRKELMPILDYAVAVYCVLYQPFQQCNTIINQQASILARPDLEYPSCAGFFRFTMTRLRDH